MGWGGVSCQSVTWQRGEYKLEYDKPLHKEVGFQDCHFFRYVLFE